MLNVNHNIFTPVRNIRAYVALYTNGATSFITIPHNQDLMGFTLDRFGESKFFGYGVCARANIRIKNKEGKYNITTDNYFRIFINDVCVTPPMYVSEVYKNETTNELSITTYDALEKSLAQTTAEISLTSYTIREYATAIAELLGAELQPVELEEFELSYEQGANLEGTESLREALNAIAEATQTIYFINAQNQLVFKRLDRDGEPIFTIDKSKYFELESRTNRRLAGICSATALGDNLEATLDISGTTQYIRDNPFWDLREDRAQLVDNALANVGGLTINQFTCSWRGNYLLEPGDKIGLITKENETIYSYFLNDSIEYDGAFRSDTEWEYLDVEETANNPTTIGEAIKQTFAKVDKVNKRIEMVVSEVDANSSRISGISATTNDITATVYAIEETTKDAIGSVSESVNTLSNQVQAKMSAEDVKIEIKKELNNGVTKVETNTGFTFDDNGLTVSKSDSSISTTITEDGMTVSKDSEELLTANNEGVKAIDLHATTFLIVGNNSRFEDYGRNRTGCFWIGG